MNNLLLTLAMAALGQLGGSGAAPGIGIAPGLGVPLGIPPALVGGFGRGIRIGISAPGLRGLPGGYGGYGGPGPGYPGRSDPIGAYPGGYAGGLAPGGSAAMPGFASGVQGTQGLRPRQPLLAAPAAPPSSEAEAFGLAPYR